MKALFQDIRFGIRQLIKMPGFSFTAIVSLALGIGATTAVFSVVYAILLDPYAYKDSDRMVHMRLTMPSGDLNGFGVTGTQWQELRKSPVVEDTFMEDDWSLTVTNASSSPYTLKIMTWCAGIATPIVLLYQGWTYWVFRKRIGTQHIADAVH